MLKCFGAEIDWSAEIYASAKVWAPWNLRMEKGACVGPDAIVYNQAMVSFGENACLSQYAYVCTAGHGRSENDNDNENDNENDNDEGHARKFHTKVSHEDKTSLPINNAETGLIVAPVTLHKNAWVGTRAYINMGVEVGENAIVGACACVFKDVEAGNVVGGNPAVVLKR